MADETTQTDQGAQAGAGGTSAAQGAAGAGGQGNQQGAKGAGAQQSQAQGQGTQTTEMVAEETLSFEQWYAKQAEPVKGLIDDQTHSLKTALDAERKGRKDLEKQLKEMAKTFEKDSEGRKSLDALAAQFAAENKKASFYDSAHTAGATNLRLLYLAANDAGLVEENGRADFEGLKTRFPELFAQARKVVTPPPPGNAGSGTQQAAAQKPVTMNELIRKAAGRTQ